MLSDAPFLAVTGFITIALGLIVLVQGYRNARKKQLVSHKKQMKLAVFLLFAFLTQYVIRFATVGETHFSGSPFIRNYIYLPILITHIITAITTIVLIIIHVVTSLRNEMVSDIPQFPADYRERHHSFGRWVFRFWLISYLGGILVFILLYLI